MTKNESQIMNVRDLTQAAGERERERESGTERDWR